ncbi:hypothetical protein KBA63_00100 [Candidatus Woesebacteria bacterium]|nr:hypothetical protein [Candidatus Woesebacteria bacterium]
MWNYLIRRAFETKGVYYYFLPEGTQAKKIIWDGINNDGFKFLDYCPEAITKAKNGVEMKITLLNGSIIQLIGTDRYDSIRGTNPIGCIFSEFAFQNPMAWEIVKPILKVNGGWAVFNSTPNGKNHFYELYEMAQNNEDWFCEKLTISDTDVLTEKDMDEERKEGMDEEMIQQEYYCSFDIGALGAYYSKQMLAMREEDRICTIPIDFNREVEVTLDLGKNDSTAVIFTQKVGKEIRIVDYYEARGEEIDHYVTMLLERKYRYSFMNLPHDAFAKRLGSPQTIAEQFESAGFKVRRVPELSINAGIQLVRKYFPNFWMDKVRCKQLERILENYHHEWDKVKKVFKDQPLHDWSSHGADAMRYMAIMAKETMADANAYEDAVNAYNQPATLTPELGVKVTDYRAYQNAVKNYIA